MNPPDKLLHQILFLRQRDVSPVDCGAGPVPQALQVPVLAGRPRRSLHRGLEVVHLARQVPAAVDHLAFHV